MTESPLFEACPLECGAELETTSINLPEGNLKRCTSCGQLLSACTASRYDESMQEFDVPEGTLPSEQNVKRLHKRVGNNLKQAAAILGQPASALRLLDTGCSSGSLLHVASEIGFNVAGVEPAPQAAATAQKAGFDVFNGLLHEAQYPDNSFDIVTLYEVIEHLTNPLELVREVYRILKPGGLFLIGTGNADSWSVDALGSNWSYFSIEGHGGHISFFTPASIRLLAEKTGFLVEDIQTKRICLAERGSTSAVSYRFKKLFAELMALPARWLNKGHDMFIILRKPDSV
ncbi:MAG: class I SAM-dependent methyltransferase [Mariprofundaceae bacterium]|nr:class I SAM-dependent methyltransferase [Mariprofundaceae bacterium]